MFLGVRVHGVGWAGGKVRFIQGVTVLQGLCFLFLASYSLRDLVLGCFILVSHQSCLPWIRDLEEPADCNEGIFIGRS